MDRTFLSFFTTIKQNYIYILHSIYYHIYNNLQPIKADWLNQRCNPGVIPFAGLINRPDDMSAYDFTAENFNYCIQNILQDIVGVFLAPIHYLVNSINIIVSGLSEAVQSIRKISLNRARGSATGVQREYEEEGESAWSQRLHFISYQQENPPQKRRDPAAS